MSATNRGAVRNEADFYKTPDKTIDLFFDNFTLTSGMILEPCAGDGAIIKAIVRAIQKNNWDYRYIIANEIRAEERDNLINSGADLVVISDFIKDGKITDASTIISNPPYSLAQEVIEHCFEIAPNAEVIMLLRLNFLGSGKRKSFFNKYPVTQLYTLSERPSFGTSYKCKKCGWQTFVSLSSNLKYKHCPSCENTKLQKSTSDATEYAWFVWSKYRQPLIKVI
jgi:DNA-directed RNA polymerase subunit RPC12/RpoP